MSDKSIAELSRRANEAAAEVFKIRLEQLDFAAERLGFGATRGMNVAYLLLAERFNWTPSQVRSLTSEELDLFLDYVLAER